jgi:hypothetical protein
MSRDGRSGCVAAEEIATGEVSIAGKGNFLDRDPLPSLSVMDLCSRRIPATC